MQGTIGEYIEKWRKALAQRIITALPGAEGGVAATLLTGVTSTVPPIVRQHYAVAGLAHLLAVAGLHLGIVMGCIGLGVRKILACWPYAALHWPIKQMAILLATLAGGIYAVMTGLHVPVLRSYLMVLWVVVALLAHRPVLSAHRFGWAIMVLLLIWPSLVRDLSFQMSVMAVMGLVFGYLALAPVMGAVQNWGERRFGIRGRKWSGEVLSLLLASILAGSATLVVTMAHFGTLQPYFVVANLVAVPLMGMWILPWGMVALMCMVIHGEGVPLHAMGYGIHIVNYLADEVASWPGAQWAVPHMSESMLYASMGGICALCLLHKGWRLVGPGVVGGVMVWVYMQPVPALLVSADSRVIGLVTHRHLVVVAGHNAFIEQRWKEAWRLEDASPDMIEGLTCEADQCAWTRAGQPPVFLYVPKKYNEQALKAAVEKACSKAHMIISTLRFYCPPRAHAPTQPIIDRHMTGQQGAVAVWFRKNKALVVTDQDIRGVRPWVREPAMYGIPRLPLAASE